MFGYMRLIHSPSHHVNIVCASCLLIERLHRQGLFVDEEFAVTCITPLERDLNGSHTFDIGFRELAGRMLEHNNLSIPRLLRRGMMTRRL